MVTDEVTDMIASIVAERQAKEREGDTAAARATALRLLQELLAREEEALRVEGPGSARAANVEAVKLEIGKLRPAPAASHPQPPQQNNRGPQAPRRDPPHHQMRNRGRRTMGRGGR